MKIFDRVTVVVLLSILIIVSVAVLILKAIRPALIADVMTRCQQINFELRPDAEANQPVLLLNNNLWIKEATINNFDRIQIKSSPSIQDTEMARLADKNTLIVSPRSSASYITIKSEEDAFALSDIFVATAAKFSLGIIDSGFLISLQEIGNAGYSGYTANFSLGDTLYLSLLDCAFLDSEENILHQTNSNTEEAFALPVSLAQPYLVATADSGKLSFEADWQLESLSDDTELIKDLKVSNIDYYKLEYTPGGKTRERNTVLEGKVMRRNYSLDDSVNIKKEMIIKAQPGEAMLNYLTANSSSIEANLQYKVKSLKLGQNINAEHELVKSKLELLWEDKTLFAIYSLSVIVFGAVLKLFLNKS